MMRLYLAAITLAAIFFAFITGVYIGRVKCSASVANANAEQINNNYKIREVANETVMHTGGDDVRRVLREKYTIAE